MQNLGWEDPEYRKCYQKILEGEWEEYDPFDVTHRVNAVQDMYNCSGKCMDILNVWIGVVKLTNFTSGGCSMFRSFQGWVSLSDVESPNGGTLRVCPLMKETTSYIMMRPLLSDLKDSR